MNRLEWRHAFAIHCMKLTGDYCRGFIQSKSFIELGAFGDGLFPEWCAQLQLNVENALAAVGLTGMETIATNQV